MCVENDSGKILLQEIYVNVKIGKPIDISPENLEIILKLGKIEKGDQKEEQV